MPGGMPPPGVENLPAGRLVNSEALLLLARQRPRELTQLGKARLKSSVVGRHGASLLEAIRLAEQDPAPERSEQVCLSPATKAREQRLKTWRREESERRTKAEGRTVPLQLVLPSRALEHLALHGATNMAQVPQLGLRREALYGDALRGLCG